MARVNILNKQGMLSKEDRKEPLEHGCTCLDLSEPIQASIYGGARTNVPMDWYSRYLASFICWWTHFVQKDLNGFSGFNNVKFKFINFSLH